MTRLGAFIRWYRLKCGICGAYMRQHEDMECPRCDHCWQYANQHLANGRCNPSQRRPRY